jgi:hypothetical protein
VCYESYAQERKLCLIPLSVNGQVSSWQALPGRPYYNYCRLLLVFSGIALIEVIPGSLPTILMSKRSAKVLLYVRKPRMSSCGMPRSF